MKCNIEHIGGMCPMQAEGTMPDGKRFYFRARWKHWTFGVHESDPVGVSAGMIEGFRLCAPWGNGPYEAGYMPDDVAEAIIAECAEKYATACN